MIKKETCFMKTKRFCDVRTECSAETSLPDYNTDVRKILHVSSKPHPISSFASGEGIECSGEVTFEVVYLDFEGAVCSASFSGDYSFKVKCDTESYKDSLVETRLGALSLRLMSPRKIAAKATLESCVTVVTEEMHRVSGDALNADMSPEIDTLSISAKSVAITPPAEREYGCSLARFDGKTTDEVHLVHLSVKPMVERLDVADGEVMLAGHIEVEALIKTDEYPLYRLDKSLELSQKIPLGDIQADADLRSALEVVSASVATNGDEGGVEMVLNVITEARVVGEKNMDAELISDMYLCDYPCECAHEIFNYEEYVGRYTAVREISKKISSQELGVGKLREIIYADATAKICEVEHRDSGAWVEGDIYVSAIATEQNDDGSVEFVPLKFSVKIQENVNLGCHIDDKNDVFVNVSLTNTSTMVDIDCVHFKSDVVLSADVSRRCEAKVLTDARAVLSEPYYKKPACISVYYPSEGDTLYTVAKAYHTTKEKIISDNFAVIDTVSQNGEISSLKHLIIT